MHHYCTYFDKNFLVRGLALYRSLLEHAGDFRLYILCFDDEVYTFLNRQCYERVIPISLSEFEKGDYDLTQCKGNRSKIEYFFTCTPSLPLYIMNNFDGVDMISYVDADIYFFSSPEPIYQEFGDNSIMIIEHRFSDINKYMEVNGKYNVGLLCFSNDSRGRECLEWWRNKCIDWCYDRAEDGRYADQKYLDCWPECFEKVCVLKNKGANLAPWNIDNFRITKKKDYFVDEDKLIFYHFHGLNKLSSFIYSLGTRKYFSSCDWNYIVSIYKAYIACINSVAATINEDLGSNRFKKHLETSMCDLLKTPNIEEVILHCNYLIVFSISRILSPFYALAKHLRTAASKFLGVGRLTLLK